jgi:glucose/arabinose dehydrogenase
MDVAIHPKFAENRLVYVSYTKPLDEKRRTVAIARGRFDGRALTEVRDIFVADAAGTSRIAFGRDGTLFVTRRARTRRIPTRKAARCRAVTMADSERQPVCRSAGHKPEVIRRPPQLARPGDASRNRGWLNENGPNGGDRSTSSARVAPWLATRELGAPPDYGKPSVLDEGFEPPLYWMPSIAVSGMAFYTGDRFPKWKGDVFVGALRTGEIPGTGHLERLLFNEKMEELRRESLLGELRQRIRDVRQGPDGLLYLLTDEKEGAVLRIEPAP